MEKLPLHLQKYIVSQNYERYTPINQACWRYILRQLKNYLSKHAHSAYLDGLQKTGIEIDQIPRIEDISAKLQSFGWRALPVSGFIPPAAFMELQSLGVLPIASDMRSIDHLEYTPAPDIVHEAAGHAPILIDPEFAAYLRQYAQIARKAIISKEDLDVYSAIRDLSDIKESPNSTPAEIEQAQKHLDHVSAAVSHVSEAAQLGRMNWWTAEYGLVGDLQNPKIYGAGLLSSVGESKWCLSDKVKKIALSVDCIQQGYDITEPQPQLFVTPNFKVLGEVLEQMADQMAFRTGGISGLEKIKTAQSINTIQFNSGLQISGVLKNYILHNNEPAYIQMEGPSQLSLQDRQIKGHGKEYHSQGYGTAVGHLSMFADQCPSELDASQMKQLGLYIDEILTLNYVSGVQVKGKLVAIFKRDQKPLILSFADCTVTYKDQVLFKPEWGTYDLSLGCQVSSVFGGPADREAFGEIDDFVAKRVPEPKYSATQLEIFSAYQQVRNLRKNNVQSHALLEELQHVFDQHVKKHSEDWLLFLEIYELLQERAATEPFKDKVLEHLQGLMQKHPKIAGPIQDGIQLCAPSLSM